MTTRYKIEFSHFYESTYCRRFGYQTTTQAAYIILKSIDDGKTWEKLKKNKNKLKFYKTYMKNAIIDINIDDIIRNLDGRSGRVVYIWKDINKVGVVYTDTFPRPVFMLPPDEISLD